MKYQISFYSENHGSMSETINWTFETEAEAKSFYDGYDLKRELETEVMTGGYRNNKEKKFVLDFGRYDDENEVFEVFESQEVTISDLED